MQSLNLVPLTHRCEDTAKLFFHQILSSTSCRHDLLQAPRNVNLMSILRLANNITYICS